MSSTFLIIRQVFRRCSSKKTQKDGCSLWNSIWLHSGASVCIPESLWGSNSWVSFKCFFFFMCALQLTVYYQTMSLNVSLVFFASILPLEFKQTKCYQPCYNGSAYILTSTASEIHFIINNSSSILYCTVFNLFLFWHRQFFDHRLQF